MKALFSLRYDEHEPGYAGFSNKEDLLVAWVLSVHQADQFYDCLLVASRGAWEILEPLDLPFVEVNVVEFAAMPVPQRLWSFPKLYALDQVEGPAVHIDHDVFLHEPLPDFDGALFQNREDAENYHVYADVVPYISDTPEFAPRPKCWVRDYPYAYNCGVIGINDEAWHDAYVRPVTEWAQSGRFGEGMVGEDFFYPVAWEQYTAACAEQFAGHADVLGHEYHDVQALASEIGYTHLVSRAKDDEELRRRLHSWCKREYPDRYATLQLLTN